MYYQKWVEFLNEHEAMSLLNCNEPNTYTPINPSHFVIYDNMLVKSVVIEEHDIVISGYHNNGGSVKHIEPYNNVDFAQIIS